MATPPSSSPPVSFMATPSSSSMPVNPMPTSPSSSTPVPIDENTADLRTRRQRTRQRSRQQRRRNSIIQTAGSPDGNFRARPRFREIIPTADGLSDIIPTAVSLIETPLPVPPPPVSIRSVDEGRQQPKESRTGLLTPPPPPVSLGSIEGRQLPKERRPAKIRPVKQKDRRPPSLCRPVDHVGGRFSALVDLPDEEKPSSNLPEASVGLSQPKEDLLGEEKPSSDVTDASYGQSQPKEVPKPSWDTDHVLSWRDVDLPTPVYVRMDRSRDLHTYPPMGGPFQNLDEVRSAVETHARGNSIRTSEELSYKECVIRKFLLWPDGTTKVSTRLQIAERELKNVQNLIKALLDKRNDDKGCADELKLKDIIHWQSICEGADKWYYHLNITVKTQGAADDAGGANLFFAEITRDQNDTPGYYLSSFSSVNDDDKVFCHGCINNGSTDMKHPPADSFKGGHKNVGFPLGFGPCNDKEWREPHNSEDDKELIKEEEDRIRASFDYLDDEAFLNKLMKKRRKNQNRS